MEKKEQKNTKLGYMYRDADNYKVGRTVIFKGELKTSILKDELANHLEMFVPSQIGLENLQGELQSYDSKDNDVDHCWHEFTNIETTDEEPTDERTIHEFTKEALAHTFVEEEVSHILNN